MMSKERMGRSAFIGNAFERRWERLAVTIQSLRGARLAIILLHVAALAVTFESRVEVLVAGPVRVGAVGPLGVSPFDGKSAHPFSLRVLDGKRIGNIVTSGTHFGTNKHSLVIALVLGWIQSLVCNFLPEDLAGVGIHGAGRLVRGQRAEAFREHD